MTELIASFASSDIGNILLGALVAMLVAWLNTRLGIWRDDRAEKRRTKGHIAYSVAMIERSLREYLKACLLVVRDEGQRITGEEYFEDWVTSVRSPTLALPDKIDWTLIDQLVLYHALAIEVIQERMEREIQSAYDEATPPDRWGFIETRQKRYLDLAAFTLSLLRDLHEAHPHRFTSRHDDFAEEIAEQKVRVDKKQDEMKKSRIPMFLDPTGSKNEA